MNQSRLMAFVLFFCVLSIAFALPPGGGSGSAPKTYRGFEGKVTDENGRILKGVQITLFDVDASAVEDVRSTTLSDEKKNLTTTTGGNGRYRFVALRPGYYRIRYTIEGYQTLEKLMNFKRGSKDAVMNIQLRKVDQPVPAGQQR